ncbi:unnamed protein product [Allacma fusca]|uniref:Uncharacterized protein n=1 Tax=Allacma fusca TaxID=39272 RepID=A0A8J2JR41_9HEXA|nr:unnamed protein product [Allacma fusca]
MNFSTTIFLAALEVLAIIYVSAVRAENATLEDPPEQVEVFSMENASNITEEDKQFPLVEPCAVVTCNRANPYCCKGYHCSIQLFLFGGLGFCHYNQPPRPGAIPLIEASPAAAGASEGMSSGEETSF